MTDERHISARLDEAPSVFADAAGGGPHIDDEALALLVERGDALSDEQKRHAARCAECRAVLAEASRGGESAEVVPLRRRLAIPLGVAGALAAGVAALFLVLPDRPTRQDGFQPKGVPVQSSAGVRLIATAPDGTRRDLSDGSDVARDDRLGFFYRNPSGAHRTLTILGWDGTDVHWYYPEAPGPAQAIERSESKRLPFDVLPDDHAPGKLVVVAAFDADPGALAERLRSGATKELGAATVATLELR